MSKCRIVEEINGYGKWYFTEKVIYLFGFIIFWSKYAYHSSKQDAEDFIKREAIKTTYKVVT